MNRVDRHLTNTWLLRCRRTLWFLPVLLAIPLTAGASLFKTPEQDAADKFENGDYVEAASEFSDAYRRGVALYRAGRYKEAGKAFASVERPDVKADALYNLGNTRYKQSDYRGAIDAYEQSLKLRANDEDTLHNLGLAKKMVEQTKSEMLAEKKPEKPEEKKEPEKKQSDQKKESEQKKSGEQKKESEQKKSGEQKKESEQKKSGDQKKESEQKKSGDQKKESDQKQSGDKDSEGESGKKDKESKGNSAKQDSEGKSGKKDSEGESGKQDQESRGESSKQDATGKSGEKESKGESGEKKKESMKNKGKEEASKETGKQDKESKGQKSEKSKTDSESGKKEQPEGESGGKKQKPETESKGEDKQNKTGEGGMLPDEKKGDMGEMEQEPGIGEKQDKDKAGGDKNRDRQEPGSGSEPKPGSEMRPGEITEKDAKASKAVEKFDQLGTAPGRAGSEKSPGIPDKNAKPGAAISMTMMDQLLDQVEGDPAYLLRNQFMIEERQELDRHRRMLMETRPW